MANSKPDFHLLPCSRKLRLVDAAVMRYAEFFNLGALHPLHGSGVDLSDWFRALIIDSDHQRPWIPTFLEFCDFRVRGTESIAKYLRETYSRNYFPLSKENRKVLQDLAVSVRTSNPELSVSEIRDRVCSHLQQTQRVKCGKFTMFKAVENYLNGAHFS